MAVISGFIDYDNKLAKSGESDARESACDSGCQCHSKNAICKYSLHGHAHSLTRTQRDITYGIPIVIKLTWLLRDATE